MEVSLLFALFSSGGVICVKFGTKQNKNDETDVAVSCAIRSPQVGVPLLIDIVEPKLGGHQLHWIWGEKEVGGM